jgi:hypothetical protein
MPFRQEIRRTIRVGHVRIDTTNCPWCTDEAVCSSCSAKADDVREVAQFLSIDEAVAWLRDVAEAEPDHPRAQFFREAANDIERRSKP